MAPASIPIFSIRHAAMSCMVALTLLVCLPADSSGQTQFERLRPLRLDSRAISRSPTVSKSLDERSPIQVDANAFSAIAPKVVADVPDFQPDASFAPPAELNRPIQLKPIELDSLELSSLERASIFGAEASQPVVMVWLNSDLEDQLLSQRQLQQLLGRIPNRDQTTAPHGDEQQPVRLVNFVQEGETKPAEESPDDAESETAVFQKRIENLKARYDTRKAQIENDKTLDPATLSDLNSQINSANDWLIKAAAELANYQSEKEKYDKFDTTLKKKQAQQKAAVRDPESPDAKYLKLSRQHIEVVNELMGLVLSDQTQKNALDRRDARNKTDRLKSEAETLAVKCADAIRELSATTEKKAATLQDLRDRLRSVRELIATRDARVTELPGISNSVSNDLAEVKDQIEGLRAVPEDNKKSARKLVLESKELALGLQEVSIRLEAKRQDQTGRLYPLQASVLTDQIKRLEPELKTFRDVLGTLRDAEIQVREKLDQVELNDEVTARFEVLKNLARTNKNFTDERSELIDSREKCRVQLAKILKQINEVKSGFESIKDEIESLGKAASGIRLIEHQRTLMSTGESQMRRMQLYNDLQSSKIEALRLKELRDQLSNRQDYLANLTAMLDVEMSEDDRFEAMEEEERERVRDRGIEIAGRLLATQESYVNELIKEYGSYVKDLADLDVQHEQLIKSVQDARAYSEQHALWVRSATPVKLQDIATSRKAAIEFFDGRSWQSLVNQVGQRLTNRPYDAAVLALFMGVMFVVKRRLRWSHD